MRVAERAVGGLGLIMSGCVGMAGAQTQLELDSKSGGGLFARMWRTSACLEAGKAEYPSIERNAKGELILMFTQTAEDRAEGVLALSVSRDEGKTWSDPRTIYQAPTVTPKAMGTLTRLDSGKLLAPFVAGDVVRMLVGEGGKRWRASDPIDCSPLQDAAPYAKIVSLGPELLMPLFGKLPAAGREAPCSGVLRSTDSGKTWGAFTVIACDRDQAQIAYGPTAVHADPGGNLLALISVGGETLYRSLSADGGKTWTPPEQRLIAGNPALAAVGSSLACVNRSAVYHGVVRVQYSDNLFDSWSCDRAVYWNIRGEHISATRRDGSPNCPGRPELDAAWRV